MQEDTLYAPVGGGERGGLGGAPGPLAWWWLLSSPLLLCRKLKSLSEFSSSWIRLIGRFIPWDMAKPGVPWYGLEKSG